jgi:type IV pilus assembly protein PilM
MATGLGIDVGSESIKAVQISLSNGQVSVIGALKIPRPAAETTGPDEDGQLVPEVLGEELRRANLRRCGVMGLTGREINLRYLPLAPMPPDKLKLVVDMEIGGKLGAKSQAAAPTGLAYDYHRLSTPDGSKGDLVVMAGACKEDFLLNVYGALKKAGLDARCLTPSCFGLVNAYLRTQKIPRHETVVLLEVGHEMLEIAILEERSVYFARSATGGGRKFTVGLDKLLKAGLSKAADFKHHRAKLFAEGEPIPNKQELAFQSALKEVADNIAGAVRSSLVFCRTQARLPKLDFQRVYLSGGGARLNGLREYLEKKLGKPVQVLDLASGLDLRKLPSAAAKCFEGEVPDMAVALGLAVIDADENSFHFKLLPEQIVKKRTFWGNTIYSIAAGLVLLLGLYWPITASGDAAQKSAARAAFFEDKKKAAREQREAFKAAVEENRNLTRKVEYYARQTRMNRLYLDLLACLRREMPKDVMLNYFGPPSEGSGWTASEEAPRKLEVRGVYDPAAYPGTKFNEAFEVLRQKLLTVPGVAEAENENLTDSDARTGQGVRFVFKLSLQDPAKPLKAAVVAPPASAPAAAAPAPANDNTQKQP